MTPESRIVLWSCGAAVVIATVVALCIHAAQYVPAWAWWTPAVVVALAVAVAYCWGWTVRQKEARAAERHHPRASLLDLYMHEEHGASIRRRPWWRVALWGLKDGER